MTEQINFIANTADFKSVKKMRVLDGVKKKDVLEFLASIEVSTNAQILKKLNNIVDLTSFENEISNLLGKDISSFLNEINSSGFNKIVEKNIKKEYSKDLNKIIPILRSHSLNFYLLKNKLLDEDSVGYYKIIYPTRKKILKKVIKK